MDQKCLNLTPKGQIFVLLYGSPRIKSKNLNQNVINLVIKYVKSTWRSNISLFNGNQ